MKRKITIIIFFFVFFPLYADINEQDNISSIKKIIDTLFSIKGTYAFFSNFNDYWIDELLIIDLKINEIDNELKLLNNNKCKDIISLSIYKLVYDTIINDLKLLKLINKNIFDLKNNITCFIYILDNLINQCEILLYLSI